MSRHIPRFDKEVLFICTSLAGGGAEKQLLIMAHGMAVRGVRCSICVLGDAVADGRYKAMIESCEKAGIRIFSARRRGGRLSIVAVLWLVHNKTEVVLWTWGYRAEMIRIFAWIFWPHNSVFSIRSASEDQIFRRRHIFRIGVLLGQRYISNSHRGVELAERVAHGVGRRSLIVYNGVEAGWFGVSKQWGRKPDRLRIVMLGNVRYRIKGYDLALQLGKLIQDEHLPIEILIGGAQQEGEPSLSQMIKDACVEDVITWVGPVSSPLDFLRLGDVFLLLSRYEGMPNALFEAMTLGLPCIATEVGDLKHFEHESQGLMIVPVGNVDIALERVRWVLDNWDEAVAMGRRAKAYCHEKFSEEAMVDAVIEALDLDQAPSPVV